MTKSRSRLALVSSLAGVTQRLVQLAATLITMPMVLHALGKAGFGIWAAAASLAWMTALFDLGLGYALLTGVARTAKTDPDRARQEITAAFWLSILLGTLEAATLAALIPIIAPTAAIDSYRIAALALAINVPASLAGAVWSGLQKVYMVWLWDGAQTILTVIGLFALTHVTHNPLCYVAVTAGGVLFANGASFLHLLVAHPELRPRLALPSRELCGSLIKRGCPYLLLGVALTLAVYSDNMIALALLGAEGSAVMAVAQRACMTALNVLWASTQPLWPAFTDAATRGDYPWLKRHVLGAGALVTACAVAGSAIMVLFGRPILQLWLGGGLTISPGVLWAMAAWIVIPTLGRIPDVLLNSLGVVWFQVRVALVYSVMAFALKMKLASIFGVAGILVSTGIAYGLTHLPAYVWWTVKWMRTARVAEANPHGH